jgi:hypothetical protein
MTHVIERSATTAAHAGGDGDSRARRVLLLLGGVVLLSLADLWLTLLHLSTIGMMEANPIAAWLIRSTESALALSLYKGVTVGVCVALLFRLRRRPQAEWGAWCAVAIMIGLSLMWQCYRAELADPEHLALARSGALGTEWLVLK